MNTMVLSKGKTTTIMMGTEVKLGEKLTNQT